MRQRLIYFLTCCLMFTLTLKCIGQADSRIDKVIAAAKADACHTLNSDDFEVIFVSEDEKFWGAVCLYKNGFTDRATLIFEDLHKTGRKRKSPVMYWLAKCQAKIGNNQLAWDLLSDIPTQSMRATMLTIPEFSELMKSNAEFKALYFSKKPSFNGWTVILAFIAFLGLFSSIFFFVRSRVDKGLLWLGIVVLSFSLILVSYVLIWTKYSSLYPRAVNFWHFLTLLIGPSFYFYMLSVFKTSYSWKTLRNHFAIPILSLALALPAIVTKFNNQFLADLFAIGTSSYVLVSHLILYTIWIRLLLKNEWQIDTNINKWSKLIAASFTVYTLSFLSYFVLVGASFFNPQWDYSISFVMAGSIMLITYLAIIKKRIFESEPIEKFIPLSKYKTSALTEKASHSILAKMNRLLTEEKVYKENELRLDDLAAYLDISRHQLSQIINEKHGVNFFELINGYRVQHVKEMLQNPNFQHYTIQQIAFEAGFNNKASFNRYFKKEFGLTPSAYRIKVMEDIRP